MRSTTLTILGFSGSVDPVALVVAVVFSAVAFAVASLSPSFVTFAVDSVSTFSPDFEFVSPPLGSFSLSSSTFFSSVLLADSSLESFFASPFESSFESSFGVLSVGFAFSSAFSSVSPSVSLPAVPLVLLSYDTNTPPD